MNRKLSGLKRAFEEVRTFISNFWSPIAGIIAIFYIVFNVSRYLASHGVYLSFLVFMFFFISIFVVCIFALLEVRRREQALHKVFPKLHEINHIYRDTLCKMFHKDILVRNTDRLHEEEITLRAVSQRIQKIFVVLIEDNDCVVTIKLIINRENKTRYCFTYTRHEEICIRDNEAQMEYEINGPKGKKNTAFDKALLDTAPNMCSHFFSPNLDEEQGYENQRDNYREYYNSAIVVPIRFINSKSDDKGFLSIDTKKTDALNGDYHVYLLSALADQMYNFISLMRKEYVVNNQNMEEK